MYSAATAPAPTTYADFKYFAGTARLHHPPGAPDMADLTASAVFKAYRMAVADLRGQEAAPTLDREGFAMVDVPSVVKNFSDPMAVETAYYAQSEAIVMQATGAARVVAFDHSIRRPEQASAFPVHNDDTETSGPERVRALMGAEADALLAKRVAIVNLWRPIGHPVEDAPLAIAAAPSVSPSDFVPLDLVDPNRAREAYLVVHAPRHDWRYLSRQAPEEALLIKCYDSATDGRARFTPRSAFIDREAPQDARPRESIEVRTLVFFDEPAG